MSDRACGFCGLRASPLRLVWFGPTGAAICNECTGRIYVHEHALDVSLPDPVLVGDAPSLREVWNLANPRDPITPETLAALLPRIDELINNGFVREARSMILGQLDWFPDDPALLQRLARLGPERGER